VHEQLVVVQLESLNYSQV